MTRLRPDGRRRSPANCTSSPADGVGRAAERHPVRHLQRRRDAGARPATSSRSSASGGARYAHARAGAPEAGRRRAASRRRTRSTGTTSTCGSSRPASMAGRRRRHLPGRHPGGVPVRLDQRRRPVGGRQPTAQTLTRLTTGGQTPRQIRWSKKSAGTIYFLNGAGELRYGPHRRRASPAPALGRRARRKVPFQAKMTVRRDEEFAEMFAQCWRALAGQLLRPELPRRRLAGRPGEVPAAGRPRRPAARTCTPWSA